MPRFSIIIPNWNGERFLEACLDSLRKQSFQDFAAIVVDNASSDNSLRLLTDHYPEVAVIRLERNTGFACAVNAGIAASKSPLIALLNNDTETDPEWLASLDSAAKSHPEAAFFASKMLDFKSRQIIDSCGNGMSWSGKAYKIGEGETDGEAWNQKRFVFGACAGAAAYRAELFEKIGPFDETFVTYLEDVDIDFRAQLAGFRCLFVPEARVYHIGSATSGKGSKFGFRMGVKNHFHLIAKNYPARFLWRSIGKLVYAELRLIAAAIRDGYLAAYLEGAWAAARESGHAMQERRQIQSARRASDTYLQELILPTFPFTKITQALRGR